MKSPPSYQESVKKKEQNDFMFGANSNYDTGAAGAGADYRERLQVNKSPSPSVASLKQQLQQQQSRPSSRADNNDSSSNIYFSLNRYDSHKSQSPLTSQMNRFTNEIERELTNLTLKIEKDLESQYKTNNNKQPKPSSALSSSFSGGGDYGNGHKAASFGQCCECMKEIQSRADSCLAMGNLYHNDCFLCASCGRTLRDKAFYHINHKNYCEEDYLYSGFLQNAEKCSICGHIIVDMILQACGKSYHPGCFRCSVCNESLDGLPFTLDINNKIYCIQDYYKKYAPKCHGCGHLITPAEGSNETVRVVSMEKDFHLECYVCRDCGAQLSDESEKRCYPLDNCLLCLACHLGRLGSNNNSGQKAPNGAGSYAQNGYGDHHESKSSFAYPNTNGPAPPPPPPPPSYYQPSSQNHLLQKQSVNGYY